MPKLSTFQITLLAVFGSLGVAGVMIFALMSASGNVSTVGSVVIWGTLDDTQIRVILRESADTDNRFTGVTYVKKDPATYDEELKDALASGTGPDLFVLEEDHAIRDSGYTIRVPYEQFSRAQFESTFLDAAEPFLGKDGVVAVPILIDPLVLFWNKDALASAGISAPPQYWDQVPAAVTEIVKKSESGTVVKGGIALGNFDNIPAAKDILATMIMQAGGTITEYDSADKLRPALASEGGTMVAVTALNFYTEFADPSKPDYSWSRAFKDARQSFAAADVAMYIGHASDFKKITETNPNLNFAMAPLPQIRSARYALNSSAVYGLALSRTSKNARGALTVAYLLAAPNIMNPIAKSLGMASALRSVNTSGPAQTSSNPAVANQQSALQELVKDTPKTTDSLLSYAANISRSWHDPDPDETDIIFRDMIESTVSGARKATEAVQRADRQLGELLRI